MNVYPNLKLKSRLTNSRLIFNFILFMLFSFQTSYCLDSYKRILDDIAKSVVNIRIITQYDDIPEVTDNEFSQEDILNNEENEHEQSQSTINFGSGVIISSDGYIITNRHVIENSKNILVVTNDEYEYNAQVISMSDKHDLAIIKIDANNLNAIKFGNLNDSHVGDIVLAIGNPHGIGQTATSGIISAMYRDLGSTDTLYIQTDAAINPGNSGGALVNTKGELLGISTKAMYESSGIAFAIPVDLVINLISESRNNNATPWVSFIGQSITSKMSDAANIKTKKGVIISSVYPNGSAEQAGLQAGDIIIKTMNHKITSMNALRYHLYTKNIDDIVDIIYYRNGIQNKTKLKLTKAPETPAEDEFTLKLNNMLNGITIANLSPKLSQKLGIYSTWSGVIIKSCPDKKLLKNTLKEKYIILSFNDNQVENVEQFKSLLEKYQNTKNWQIKLKGEGRILDIKIENIR